MPKIKKITNQELLEEVTKLMADKKQMLPNSSTDYASDFIIYGEGILKVSTGNEKFYHEYQLFKSHWRQKNTIDSFFQNGSVINIDEAGVIELDTASENHIAQHYMVYLSRINPFFAAVHRILETDKLVTKQVSKK